MYIYEYYTVHPYVYVQAGCMAVLAEVLVDCPKLAVLRFDGCQADFEAMAALAPRWPRLRKLVGCGVELKL